MSKYQTSLHRIEKAKLIASQPRRSMQRPTKDKPLIISASELADWLRCRVRHHWRYNANLEPKGGSLALATGILGHGILEDWYSLSPAKRSVKAMMRVAKARTRKHTLEELKTEDLRLLEAMTTGYAAWTLDPNTDLGDAALKVRDTYPEEWFDLPLTKDGSIRVRGRFDIRFSPGSLKSTMALLESKFKKQIRSEMVENKLQLSVYLWALRKQYPKYKRYQLYYQILRKQMPGPKVKADLFHRELVERDDDEIHQWELDTQYAMLEMLDGAIYPNPMESCGFECDFKVPCLLRGNKSDLLHVLKTEYKTKERR